MSARTQGLRLVSFTMVLLMLGLAVATVNADTIYVCWDGSGDYLTIQEGIDAAQDGDTVLVADGTYTGPGNINLDLLGKPITLRSANGPQNCIIDCQDSGRGFYLHSAETADSTIAGFTITNASAQDGAGIYCSGASPQIINCTIRNCAAVDRGGAIYCGSYSHPTITGCIITANTATGGGRYEGGGGIACRSSYPTITDCTITQNTGRIGGGLFSYYSDTRLIRSTVADNHADYGAGIYTAGWSEPLIAECTITRNIAVHEAGGIYCGGSNPDISRCTIAENTATEKGGGIRCDGVSPLITNCNILANNAAIGAGIHCGGYLCDPIISNCALIANAATQHGGALACETYAAPTCLGSTFSGNSADTYGGAVYAHYFASPTISNSILWADTAPDGPEIALVVDSRATISYSAVTGGAADVFLASNSTLNWAEGNIVADPLFVDPDGPDDDPNTWEDNDYHLGTDSPCIEAGDPDFVPEPDERDIDGQMRVWDGDDDDECVADMGSDEFASIIPGDLDRDGCVNHGDLGILLADWGCNGSDMDCSGHTDQTDLGILLAHWGEGCP